MLQKIITTFFFGQVALEQAAEVSKKQLEAAREKAKAAYDEKVEGYKNSVSNTHFLAKFEQFSKEKFAKLRSCSEPFEKTCVNVTNFLGETADIKSKLATESNA